MGNDKKSFSFNDEGPERDKLLKLIKENTEKPQKNITNEEMEILLGLDKKKK